VSQPAANWLGAIIELGFISRQPRRRRTAAAPTKIRCAIKTAVELSATEVRWERGCSDGTEIVATVGPEGVYR